MSKPITQKFHIGTILSITTGVLVAPNLPGNTSRMSEIYKILNFMTGRDLMTVGLVFAGQEAIPYLLEQLPFLKNITEDKVLPPKRMKDQAMRERFVDRRVATIARLFGEYHDVMPMHKEDHDAISEEEAIRRINSNIEIIRFDPDEEDRPSDIGNISWK